MAPKTVAVRIDALLYKKMKIRAVKEGHSIKWLMGQALINFLALEGEAFQAMMNIGGKK